MAMSYAFSNNSANMAQYIIGPQLQLGDMAAYVDSSLAGGIFWLGYLAWLEQPRLLARKPYQCTPYSTQTSRSRDGRSSWPILSVYGVAVLLSCS